MCSAQERTALVYEPAPEVKSAKSGSTHMKTSVLLLLLSLLSTTLAFGQGADDSRVVPFNRADTQRCKVTQVDGRELLESVYGGTSVAISLPVTTSDGEFQLYVAVRQIGPGGIEIKPQDFGAYYSDPFHTRFLYVDKAAEMRMREAASRARTSDSGTVGANSRGDPEMPGNPPPPGSLNSTAYTGESRAVSGRDPNAPERQKEEAREDQEKISRLANSSDDQPGFLSPGMIQQGASVSGFIYFKKPKGFKVKSGQPGVLYQIDIPVNGMIFRFR
jgi:hypothetical protein